MMQNFENFQTFQTGINVEFPKLEVGPQQGFSVQLENMCFNMFSSKTIRFYTYNTILLYSLDT